MVLAEEAAVMEPAVGLGCILRSARKEREDGGGQRKNKSTTSGQVKYTSSMVVSQQDKVPRARPRKRRWKHSGHVSAFQKATVPRWIKWHLKKSIIGFNVTEAL